MELYVPRNLYFSFKIVHSSSLVSTDYIQQNYFEKLALNIWYLTLGLSFFLNENNH